MLRGLCSSRCRLEILKKLVENQLSGAELEERIGFGSSTVRRNTKILREDGWVERRDRRYVVPEERRHLIGSLVEVAELFDVYGEHRRFWDAHDVQALPREFRRDMDALAGGEVVTGTTANPRAPLERMKGLVEEASRLKMVSPSFVPEYLDMCRRCKERGVRVEFVGTGEVYRAYESEGAEALFDHYREGSLTLHRCDEPGFGLAVSDEFVTLNLRRRDGIIDLDRMYLSRSDEGVEWGKRLFERIRAGSEPVELDRASDPD